MGPRLEHSCTVERAAVELAGSHAVGCEYRIAAGNGDGEGAATACVEPEGLPRHSQPADRNIVVEEKGSCAGWKLFAVDDAHVGPGADETLRDVVADLSLRQSLQRDVLESIEERAATKQR